MRYKLTVNQRSLSVDLEDPETPLVFVLREWLGLTGTKYSCLEGICGACTVHVDGRATRACLLQVHDAVGTSITTIEGLSTDGDHPVQQAWVEEQVAQCGWCQSGQIMQAVALLEENPNPSEQDITSGMWGNFCRCGTANRVIRAITRAAAANAEGSQ